MNKPNLIRILLTLMGSVSILLTPMSVAMAFEMKPQKSQNQTEFKSNHPSSAPFQQAGNLKLTPLEIERIVKKSRARIDYDQKLKSMQMTGTESGGGGSTGRLMFYEPLDLAMRYLSEEGTYHLGGGIYLKIADLIRTLREATIFPTDRQLVDREGVEVDFYNDSSLMAIAYNVNAWTRLSESEKIKMGFHELLGLLQIPDPYYRTSNILRSLVVEGLQEEIGELQRSCRTDAQQADSKFDDYGLLLKLKKEMTQKGCRYRPDFMEEGKTYISEVTDVPRDQVVTVSQRYKLFGYNVQVTLNDGCRTPVPSREVSKFPSTEKFCVVATHP